MSLQTPLGKFLGHGSAKEGTGHWWAQRVSAVALVPLSLWFALALLGMEALDHAAVVEWIASPSFMFTGILIGPRWMPQLVTL